MTEEEKPMSVKAKWLRKKYMGWWSWEETLIRMTVLRLPVMVTR
jgi:hypothetical protein